MATEQADTQLIWHKLQAVLQKSFESSNALKAI